MAWTKSSTAAQIHALGLLLGGGAGGLPYREQDATRKGPGALQLPRRSDRPHAYMRYHCFPMHLAPNYLRVVSGQDMVAETTASVSCALHGRLQQWSAEDSPCNQMCLPDTETGLAHVQLNKG